MADKTFVFELDLSENENNNEFSYLELVKDKLGNRAPSDPFGEDDTAELMEIARQFERKYGDMVTVNKKGRRRNLRVADYRDLGAGYDSGDSFIDDSEYVELVVPPTVRTRFEGFFINTGTLEMLEDKSIDIEGPPPPKQPKLDLPGNKRPAVKKDKSKQLLERAVKQLSVPNTTASTAAKLPTTTTNGISGATSSLDAVFDSVISAGTSVDNPITITYFPSSAQPQPSVPTISQPTPPAPSTLPPLPDDLKAEVQKLLAMKSTSQGTTAKSLFTPQIEEALLRFDELLMQKNLKKATRSSTYAYMAEKLGIKSKTLLARLRKLKDAQNGASMDPLLERLRNAVKSAMVDVKTAYERDMGYYQTRLSAWEREKFTNPEAKRPGAPKKKFPFNALCKSYLEAVVSHHMEAVFCETKTYPDQDKMKTFFVSLMPIWPDGWISIKALTNASKSVFERIATKINTNGHAAPSASEVVNTGGPSKPVATPPSSSTLTPPKLAPPVPTTYLSPAARSPPSVAAAMRAATTAQSGVTVEFSSTKPITTSSPYVLQFASPSTSTDSKKETPRVTVPPIIDLTELSSTSVSSNSAKQQQLTSSISAAAPASSTVNFSPPSITTTSKSGTPTAANSACPQRRIVLNASPSTNSVVSSPTILNRAQMSSVTVPVAQFLGRGTSGSPVAATVPPQQQQQASASTLQTVTNIISAYQANFQKQQAQAQVMANMQKQAQAMVNLQKQQAQASVTKRQDKQPSIIQTQTNIQKPQQRVQQTPRQQPQQQQRVTTFPENVRYTAPIPSIIINRGQQHPQAAHTTQINSATAGQQTNIGASGNTRIAHSTSGVVSTSQRGVWGSQISTSSSSGTSQLTASLPTAQIIRTQSTQQQQQRTPSQQQQQQLMQAHSQQSPNQVQLQQFQQQQQFRAAVAGMVARNPLDYLSWTRQFDTSQNQSNEAHRNSDRNSGK